MGPEFTYKLTWHQETYDASAKSYTVKNFGTDVSGFSGDHANHPGRGRWWIWFKKDYFGKSENGCVNTKVSGDAKQDFDVDPVEQFSCVIFAKLNQRGKISWSFTWK